MESNEGKGIAHPIEVAKAWSAKIVDKAWNNYLNQARHRHVSSFLVRENMPRRGNPKGESLTCRDFHQNT